MRVPMDKVYRAFPELDRFSDAECIAWVKRAERVHAKYLALGTFVAIAGAMMLAIPAFVVGWAPAMWMMEPKWHYPSVLWLPAILWAVLVSALPFVGSLAVRDWCLRRCIGIQIAGARCEKCSYSLLGLPIHEGWVTCSECGQRLSLKQLGLTPEDLLARSGAHAAGD